MKKFLEIEWRCYRLRMPEGALCVSDVYLIENKSDKSEDKNIRERQIHSEK